MEFDIKTLVLIQSLMFVTQLIVLLIQHKVNRIYRGIASCVAGTALMSLGVIFMAMMGFEPLKELALFANPLVVLGQILIYIGMMVFLGQKPNYRILGLIFGTFIISYYYFIFIDYEISARTIIVQTTLSTIVFMTSYMLFIKKDRRIAISANFAAAIFLIYGCFLTTRVIFAIMLPPMLEYSDQATLLMLGLTIPIFASTLWTFAFIIMLNQRLNAENQEEKETVQRLLRQLENERNAAQLNSITDSLTGLSNRRYFDEMLAIEFSRLKRTGSKMSLIMMDLDYFKKFNDTYGHIAGDDCLRRFAAVIQGVAGRTCDIVARYGGEEFVIILPETAADGAKALTERIMYAVKKLEIPHEASDVSKYVTVSIGVVTVFVTDFILPEQILLLADEALYRAKKGGRNRIETVSENTMLSKRNPILGLND